SLPLRTIPCVWPDFQQLSLDPIRISTPSLIILSAPKLLWCEQYWFKSLTLQFSCKASQTPLGNAGSRGSRFDSRMYVSRLAGGPASGSSSSPERSLRQIFCNELYTLT